MQAGNVTFNYDSDPVCPLRPTPRAEFSITTLLGTGQTLFSNVAPGTSRRSAHAAPRGLGLREPDLLGPERHDPRLHGVR